MAAGYIGKLAKETGLKRMDAKRGMTIVVTQRDIRDSARKKQDRCAMAMACKRSLPIDNAFFFRSTAWLQYPNKLVRYLLPPYVQKEIVAFDRNKGMLPGEYTLTPPTPSQTLDVMKKKNQTRIRGEGRDTGERRPLEVHGRSKNGKPKKIRHRIEGVRGAWL